MENKQNIRLFLLIVSAVSSMHGLMGLQGSWLSFLFGIGLLLTLKSYSFRFGMIWGVIVFGIHLSWILALFAKHQAWGFGLVVWLLLVFWYASCAGVWFLAFNKNKIVSTVLFFVFITQISLWPFTGRREGYPLCNPILGFLNKPRLLSDCNFLQSGKITWQKSNQPTYVAYRLLDWLHNFKNNQAKIILFPESTFCFDIDHFEYFFSIWTEGFEDSLILFGTHKKEWNVVYGVYEGNLLFWYKKQHLMPFVEYIPKVFNYLDCSKIFLKNNISDLQAGEQDLMKFKGMIFQIFICSEFFFQAKKVKGYPILLLYNESWFTWEWIKNLTEKFITLFSFCYQVPVYYVSTQGRSNLL